MRATIDLTDEQRAALLALAARRGLRGYGSLVREAVERYVASPSPPPPPRPGTRKVAPKRSRATLLAWLDDGFSTNRGDGSVDHDDYIYRNR